jgi:hypothetical protein
VETELETELNNVTEAQPTMIPSHLLPLLTLKKSVELTAGTLSVEMVSWTPARNAMMEVTSTEMDVLHSVKASAVMELLTVERNVTKELLSTTKDFPTDVDPDVS